VEFATGADKEATTEICKWSKIPLETPEMNKHFENDHQKQT
jgi:hypothetical protein